jgi:hypothetical protein
LRNRLYHQYFLKYLIVLWDPAPKPKYAAIEVIIYRILRYIKNILDLIMIFTADHSAKEKKRP